METSAVSRQTTPPVASPSRPATQASADVLQPEAVPPAVNVQLSADTAARQRADKAAAAEEPREQGYTDDPLSGTLVFQVSQAGTGTVLMQLPSEQTLKLRAYTRQLLATQTPETDLSA